MGKLRDRVEAELILFVRYLAWLNATPRPDPRTRRGQRDDVSERPSRLDALGGAKANPPMPPNSVPVITERLTEIGLTEAAGMGVGPISWAAIAGWQAATGVDLAPWEARLIRRLSVEYLAENRRAESETCPPPWRAPVTERDIAAEQAALEAWG